MTREQRADVAELGRMCEKACELSIFWLERDRRELSERVLLAAEKYSNYAFALVKAAL